MMQTNRYSNAPFLLVTFSTPIHVLKTIDDGVRLKLHLLQDRNQIDNFVAHIVAPATIINIITMAES